MATRKTKKEVAKAQSTAVAEASYLQDYAGEGVAGSTEDFAIPFLRILQALSPQLNSRKGEYIKGAVEGDIFNNVTGELYGHEEGFLYVPCARRTEYIEWQLRENGGGFVRVHDNDSDLQYCKRDERNRDILPNGNQLSRHGTTYGLVVSPGSDFADPAVISATSTMLKHWMRWNTFQQRLRVWGPKGQFNPPIFGVVYRVNTVPDSNNEGEWQTWHFSPAGPIEGLSGPISEKDTFGSCLINGNIAEQAIEFRKMVADNSARVSYAESAPSTGPEPDDGGTDPETVNEEEAPFED